MGSTRRAFTEEYKASAVEFVLNDGRSIAEVARNIDVHEMTLGKWVKKARAERAEPAGSLNEDERAELEVVVSGLSSLLRGAATRRAGRTSSGD